MAYDRTEIRIIGGSLSLHDLTLLPMTIVLSYKNGMHAKDPILWQIHRSNVF